MMDETRVRKAVMLHVNGVLTEEEAAQHAGIARAQLRRCVRTSGVFASAVSADDSEPVV